MNSFQTKRLNKIISFLNKKENEKIELSYNKGIIPLICLLFFFNLISFFSLTSINMNIININPILSLCYLSFIVFNLFLISDISKLLRKRLKINKINKNFSFFKDKNDETIKKVISKFSDEELIFCHKNKELFKNCIFLIIKEEFIKRSCKKMNICYEERFCSDYSFLIESNLKKKNEINENEIINF